MKLPIYDVAIVGAGFTGSALAVQLARRMPVGSRILLLGSPKATAKGVAYGTEIAHHLLNVRAGRMSLFPDDPSHFARWLVAGDQQGWASFEAAADSYVPRVLYGRYVHETLRQSILDAAGRVHIDMVEGTANEIAPRDDGYTVRVASGIRYAVRTLALCLGHGKPEFPLPLDAIDPEARERMIADPWSDYRVERIEPDASVLFVGTGLTMVDQVLSLNARGHAGPLTALSRHGRLPAAHCPTRTEPLALDIHPGGLSLRHLARRVIETARTETAAGRDWRAVIDGLRPATQGLWRGLGDVDRRRFCRHLESIWSAARHRMAPAVAAQISSMKEDGRLTMRAGRILAVKRSRHGIVAAIQARGERTVELTGFDWMINCSGTGRIATAIGEAPLAGLVAHGLITPDRLGHGVEITPAGEAVDRTGMPTGRLYALGPMGAGTLMEITAVPDIREQCAAVAARLAEAARRGMDRFARVDSGRPALRFTS